MKKFSIVIPTFNEKEYLLGLLASINNINYPKTHYEVIVANDSSTDGTSEAVSMLFPNTILKIFETNQGRYQARKKGAESAKFENILFIDTRALVNPDILTTINQSEYKAIKGKVACGNPRNPFHIFFESIRYKIYPDFYRKYDKPIEINQDNFDSLPKGTGVFFVSRDALMAAYEALASAKMGRISSDDVKLIAAISELTPVIYHPDVKITHFIRETFAENFLHLIYRGSTFVHYYLDPSKRLFWLVLVMPILLILLLSAGIILTGASWFIPVLLILALDLLVAIYLGQSIRDKMTIALMLPICAVAFYLGVVRGIFLRIFC